MLKLSVEFSPAFNILLSLEITTGAIQEIKTLTKADFILLGGVFRHGSRAAPLVVPLGDLKSASCLCLYNNLLWEGKEFLTNAYTRNVREK